MRNVNDVLGLANEVQRYRSLLALNSDPAVARVLEGLLAEAEARLAILNAETAGHGRAESARPIATTHASPSRSAAGRS